MSPDEFTLRTGAELKDRYGAFYAKRVTGIAAADVPEVLRPLIPYAEVWGISDDGERDKLVEASPEIARADLRAILDRWNPDFDDWLAGPEAAGPKWSKAYVAFSNFRLAYDYLSAL